MQNQESIAWVRDRLSCSSYLGKTGQPVFSFKNYLVKYIQSIDPNFQASGIDKAYYFTSDEPRAPEDPESAGAYVHANTPDAAFEIKRILHDKNVGDMFPGKNI